jgi:hypothetical protein
LIDEGDLPCADVRDITGRLGRPQAGSIGERGQNLAPRVFLDLTLVSTEWSEMLVPADPLRSIGKHIQQGQLQTIELLGQRRIQFLEPFRDRLFLYATQFRTAVNNLEERVIKISIVGFLRCCR